MWLTYIWVRVESVAALHTCAATRVLLVSLAASVPVSGLHCWPVHPLCRLPGDPNLNPLPTHTRTHPHTLTLFAPHTHTRSRAHALTRSRAGCHLKLSSQSYNKLSSLYTPAMGIVSSTFAMAFTAGPEKKPWDGIKGFPTIHGLMNVTGTTLADFAGASGCLGGGFALSSHMLAPDAFHPHHFSTMNIVNVATSG